MKALARHMTAVALFLAAALCSPLTVRAADLKLNPEVLRRGAESVYGITQGDYDTTCGELFIGMGQSCTYGDILDSLQKYGLEWEHALAVESQGVVARPGLYLGIYGDEWINFRSNVPEPAGAPDISELDRQYGNSDAGNRKKNEILKQYYQTEEWKNYVNAVIQEERQLILHPDSHFQIEAWNSWGDDWLGYLEMGYGYFVDGDTAGVSVSLADIMALIDHIEAVNNGSGTGTAEVKEVKSGWQFEDGAWRYYENNARVTGWKWIDGYYYYFKDDTSMCHTCFWDVDGQRYHFNTNGQMDIGWQIIDGAYYYFEEKEGNGAMARGMVKAINGNLYCFDDAGRMLSNTEVTVDKITYQISGDGAAVRKGTKSFVSNDMGKNYHGNAYSDFAVVNGFDASDVRRQKNSVTCTAYSDMLVGKISGQIGKDVEFDGISDTIWGANGAKWAYTSTIAGSKPWSADRRLRETYYRVANGMPVVLRCGGHSVVAVGLKKTAVLETLSIDDILVGDSATGQVLTLRELQAAGYDIYRPDTQWSLAVPRGADTNPISAG